METIRKIIMKRWLSVLFLWIMAVACCYHAQAQIVVIANLGVKATDVSVSDLRDVFSGASSTFKDGAHVTPVLLKSGAVNDSFLALYIGKSDAAFRTNWRSLLFSGQGVIPRTFDSEAAVVEFVARTPGAVGYIAKYSPHDGVKILSVR